MSSTQQDGVHFTTLDDEGWENLLSLLRQRKENVAAGMEVWGVKMIPLNTLVVPFDDCEVLSQLKEQVVKLEDLSPFPRFVDVEI